MAKQSVLTVYYTEDKYEGVAYLDQTTSEASNEDEKTELKEPYSNDSDHRNEDKDNKCSLTGETKMRDFFNDIHAKRYRVKSNANCTTRCSINDCLDLDNSINLGNIVEGCNEFFKKVWPIEEMKLNTNAMDRNPTGHTISSQGLTSHTTSNDEKSLLVQNSKPNVLQTTTRSCRYLNLMRQFSKRIFTCLTAQKSRETSKELTSTIDSFKTQPREENSHVNACSLEQVNCVGCTVNNCFIDKFAFKKRKKSKLEHVEREKSSTCTCHSSRTCSVPVKLSTEHEKEPIDIQQDENKIRGQNGNQVNIPYGKAKKPAQLQRNWKICRRPKRYTHSFDSHHTTLKTNLLIVITLMMILGKTQGCKMKKTISTTDDTISMEVCYNHGSSKCEGNERWDLSDQEGLKNLFLNMAVLKGAERYSLEIHDNCSKLSLKNVTEKDIYKSTFSFSKGTSGKIDIHLNQDPILDGKEQCFLECSGNNEFLILKMAVKHGSPNVFFNLLFEEEMVRNLTANTRTRKKDLLYESDIEYKLPFSFGNFTSSLLKVLFVNGNTQLCVLEKVLMVQGCEKKELEDSSEKQWGLFCLLALPIAITILVILYIYKKKLLCFKKRQREDAASTPLQLQVNGSDSPSH